MSIEIALQDLLRAAKELDYGSNALDAAISYTEQEIRAKDERSVLASSFPSEEVSADLMALELESIAEEELDDYPGSARIVRNAAKMLRAYAKHSDIGSGDKQC